jgi:hypothetical protein
VGSLQEALELAKLLDKNGLGASTISYGIPPEDVFRELTRGGEGDSTVV